MFPNDWTAVSGGGDSCVALRSDGTLWSWKYHPSESGGDVRHTPVNYSNDWAAVSASARHVLALKRDGSLWAWGANLNGMLGLGDERERLVPTRVDAARDWASISAGLVSSLAVKRDGSLWAWGAGCNGRLGLDDYADRLVPTRVGETSTWSAISAWGEHSLALQRDGSLWAWGDNKYGEFGLGDQLRSRLGPTRVGEANDWVMARAGSHCSFGLKRDGSLWAWGRNEWFQLGLSDTMALSSPAKLTRGRV